MVHSIQTPSATSSLQLASPLAKLRGQCGAGSLSFGRVGRGALGFLKRRQYGARESSAANEKRSRRAAFHSSSLCAAPRTLAELLGRRTLGYAASHGVALARPEQTVKCWTFHDHPSSLGGSPERGTQIFTRRMRLRPRGGPILTDEARASGQNANGYCDDTMAARRFSRSALRFSHGIPRSRFSRKLSRPDSVKTPLALWI